MKILHITNAYPSLNNPIKGVFIKEQIESVERPGVINDVYFIDVKSNGLKAYLKAIQYVFSVKNSYDVVHAHHVFSAVIAIFAGASKNLITSFLSDGSNEVMFGPKLLRVLIFKTAYAFSKKRIFKLKSRVGSNPNNYFIQNGVNTSLFKELDKDQCKISLGLNVEKIYVLFVSGQNLYRPEKRYDLFLDVIEKLNELTSSQKIEVVPLAISEATRETIVLYYNAADCYLLTSDFEGSPNAVKEALACGTAVVSRNVGSAENLLCGMPRCAVIEGHDVDELAKAVLKSIQDQSYENIRFHFMKRQLDTASVANKILTIYKEMIDGKLSEKK